MNPLNVMSPAGRGRPAPSPSAYVMTAPCEKPPSTVRSEAMPVSAASASSHSEARATSLRETPEDRPLRGDARVGCERVEPLGGERQGLGKGLRIRVADLVDRVPVGAAGRQVERAARSHTQQPASRVEMIEEREQVALVGAAAVEEHEQSRPDPRRRVG